MSTIATIALCIVLFFTSAFIGLILMAQQDDVGGSL